MRLDRCSLCNYTNESETAFCSQSKCPLMAPNEQQDNQLSPFPTTSLSIRGVSG